MSSDNYFHKLHKHIWVQIIDHLTPIQPKPLSGHTKEEVPVGASDSKAYKNGLPSVSEPGATSREDIRAGALAALMRTSIAFNHLCSSRLYTNIICDDFPALLSHIHSPKAHRAILSKRELLLKTTHLHIEYSRKVGQPTYLQHMRDTAFWAVCGSRNEFDGATVEARIEAIALQAMFKAFERDGAFPPDLGRLTHVSVGAIFGGQDRLWQPIANTSCPLIKIHFCSRGGFGPLSLPPLIVWCRNSEKRGKPVFTYHYDIGTAYPSIAAGHKTRHILETHSRAYNIPTVAAITQGATINTLGERPYTSIPWGDKYLDLEVYSSSQRIGAASEENMPFPPVGAESPRRCGDERDREFVALAEARQLRKLEAQGWPAQDDDQVSWKAWIDAPPCEACGWCVERDADGDRGEIDDTPEIIRFYG